MKLKFLICVLSFVLVFASGFVFSADEKKVVEAAKSETPELELPPAIQELLQKEMDKLPPVEKHFRMAQDLHARGKMDEAIKELELALKEDPKHVPSNCELGIVYMGQNDFDKAIIQLNKTLELDPNYPKTHYALANAYARKPNPDVKLARKHLDESIRLGYHAVPWFLDYMNKLEAKSPEGVQPVVNQEKAVSETPVK
jgi:tetratricopeptide (TPR) repeat protein